MRSVYSSRGFEIRLFIFFVCTLALTIASCARKEPEQPKEEAPKPPAPYTVNFPLGLAAESTVIPPDNPLTEEKIKLGKRLFFEKKLSTDQSISCASCHVPERGFSDPRQFSIGVG